MNRVYIKRVIHGPSENIQYKLRLSRPVFIPIKIKLTILNFILLDYLIVSICNLFYSCIRLFVHLGYVSPD